MPLPPVQPSARDLADASVIEQWKVLSFSPGNDTLAGFVSGRVFAERLDAIDSMSGWARVAGRLLVLGTPAPARPMPQIDWNERLLQDPLPTDAESIMAWVKRNLFD